MIPPNQNYGELESKPAYIVVVLCQSDSVLLLL